MEGRGCHFSVARWRVSIVGGKRGQCQACLVSVMPVVACLQEDGGETVANAWGSHLLDG